MRAVSRFGTALLAGTLALVPASALAQEAPPASDTPATDAVVGPPQLQNFSLNGTVTRAADQPVSVAPAPKTQQRSAAQPAQTATQAGTSRTETAAAPAARTPTPAPSPAPRQVETAAADTPRAAAPDGNPEPQRQSQPSSSVTVALPGLGDSAGSAAPAASPGFAPEPATGTLAPEHSFSILPWLLAALALALGGGFLFWRNRQREAFAPAGGPQVDAFVAPEPAPAPRPAPAPPAAAPKAPTPATTGIVSTRLRPWIEIAFHPLRCILEDERVTIEFELELFNSGSGPARAVLAEASLFNAGGSQDREIGAFFANPVAQGERIQVIPPLKRVGIKTQVVAPRAQLQAYQLAGHEVFVPVIGFNALYSWSGGEGQTSVCYLLGRDTKSEKMGPFRLDLGPRIFRGLAAKLLPAGVRK